MAPPSAESSAIDDCPTSKEDNPSLDPHDRRFKTGVGRFQGVFKGAVLPTELGSF